MRKLSEESHKTYARSASTLLIVPLRYLALRTCGVDFGTFDLHVLSHGQQEIVEDLFTRFVLSAKPEQPTVEGLEAAYHKYMERTVQFDYSLQKSNHRHRSMSIVEVVVALFSFGSDGTIQTAAVYTGRLSHYCRLFLTTAVNAADAAGCDWEAPDPLYLRDVLEELPELSNPRGLTREERAVRKSKKRTSPIALEDSKDLTETEMMESVFEIFSQLTVKTPGETTLPKPEVENESGDEEDDDDDEDDEDDEDDGLVTTDRDREAAAKFVVHGEVKTATVRMNALVAASKKPPNLEATNAEAFYVGIFGEGRHAAREAAEKAVEAKKGDTRTVFEK